MRLGLYGGSFDPVHYGHLLLAEQCREQCQLDEVCFLPTGAPPHKRHSKLSAGLARAEMLELAIAGHPGFSVNRMETERTGITFTVDTLAEIYEENPSRELFFMIGADSLTDLPTWREPERIVEFATILAVNRGDRPHPGLKGLKSRVGEKLAARIQLVTMPGIDISATDIRRRVQEGNSIRYMTPRPVEEYIRENGLYLE